MDCDVGVRPRIIADAAPRGPERLLLLPAAAGVLVPPAAAGAVDPLLGEDFADARFPFGVAVGHGHFLVDGLAVAVVVGDRLLHAHAVLELQRPRFAQDDQAVAAEAERARVETLAQGGVEAPGHARLDRLDGR